MHLTNKKNRAYQLLEKRNSSPLLYREFESVEDLAEAIARACWGGPVRQLYAEHEKPLGLTGDRLMFPAPTNCWLWATSPGGHALDLEVLRALGERLMTDARRLRSWTRQYGGYSGFGPVPGIHTRCRYSRYYRKPQTMAERRAHALVVSEDGEPPVRRARSPNHLPNSWDDIYSHKERNWKAQHKGCKAWDR